ncbi:MAG: fluoride efflux transporter CrcB [Myxococcota bacterium]
MRWWLVFAGGGLGALARYALALWVEGKTGPGFPWGTFSVNVLGCFAIGVAATLADEHAWLSPSARLLLVTGILGGFTTFSTFGYETWQLASEGAAAAALGNVLASVGAGLVAVVLGIVVTRQLV